MFSVFVSGIYFTMLYPEGLFNKIEDIPSVISEEKILIVASLKGKLAVGK